MKQHKISKAEYFDLVNNSTYMSKINKGNVIDPTRYRLDQKQKQFKKLKADDPNFIAGQTSLQSNYARLK